MVSEIRRVADTISIRDNGDGDIKAADRGGSAAKLTLHNRDGASPRKQHYLMQLDIFHLCASALPCRRGRTDAR